MTTRIGITGIAVALALAASAALGAETLVPTEIVVVVEQRYEARTAFDRTLKELPGIELPVAETVEDIVFAIGADVADGSQAGPDSARITVTIIGEALGRRYIERDNDYLYTGAQLSGEVQLTTATGEVYRRPFTSLTSMPFKFSTVNLGYDQPANAPFAETLAKTGGMANALAEVIIAAWGVEAILPVLVDGDDTARADVANLLGDLGTSDAVTALIEALELDDNAVVRQRAAWSLGRIGDNRAIPSLIEALDDQSGDVRWFAGWSLRTITGQDMGTDREAWSDWWAANGDDAEG